MMRQLLITLACLYSCSPFSSTGPHGAVARVASTGTSSHPAAASRTGFRARVLHWSSPESPFYDPNATESDLIDISLRQSKARVKYLAEVMRAALSSSPFRQQELPVSISPEYMGKSFVLHFRMGTPLVDAYALPDTGSTWFWLQCEPCNPCQHQSVPGFAPGDSKSYRPFTCDHCSTILSNIFFSCTPDNMCNYKATYEDGSYSGGAIASETFSFDYNTVPDLMFGCGFQNLGTPMVGDNPAGVMGLNYNFPSIFARLAEMEGSGFFRFSYCLSKDPAAPGNFDFGSVVPRVLGDSRIDLEMNRMGWYVLGGVDGLYVDGQKLVEIPDRVFEFMAYGRGKGGVVLDTGTDFTLLHPLAMQALVSKLSTSISMKPLKQEAWPLCYRRRDFQNYIRRLPRVEFRFRNSDGVVQFKDHHLWLENLRSKQTCLAMHRRVGDDFTVLGMHQQVWVRVTCDLDRFKLSWKYTNPCD